MTAAASNTTSRRAVCTVLLLLLVFVLAFLQLSLEVIPPLLMYTPEGDAGGEDFAAECQAAISEIRPLFGGSESEGNLCQASPRKTNATTIVILVDALRPDMLLSSTRFPQMSKLFKGAVGIKGLEGNTTGQWSEEEYNQYASKLFVSSVVAEATAPTVTLPKLKSIWHRRG